MAPGEGSARGCAWVGMPIAASVTNPRSRTGPHTTSSGTLYAAASSGGVSTTRTVTPRGMASSMRGSISAWMISTRAWQSLQDVAGFFSREVPVDRHGIGTDHRRGPGCFECRDIVAQKQRDRIAGPIPSASSPDATRAARICTDSIVALRAPLMMTPLMPQPARRSHGRASRRAPTGRPHHGWSG